MRIKKICKIAVSILLVMIVAFGIYVSRYYHADEAALAALNDTENVSVRTENGYILFDGPGEGVAYIFYPGAKVETESYAPLMRRIAESGMDVYLVDMPFHLAFFGMNRAGEIMVENEAYDRWYIGGHSLGGAMAASYAAKHLEELDGVILMAAYPTSSLMADDFTVLSLYGSEDQVLNQDSFIKGRTYMPENYHDMQIEGGNHAGFGNYGEQSGDGTASISASEQQQIVVNMITKYIDVQ